MLKSYPRLTIRYEDEILTVACQTLDLMESDIIRTGTSNVSETMVRSLWLLEVCGFSNPSRAGIAALYVYEEGHIPESDELLLWQWVHQDGSPYDLEDMPGFLREAVSEAFASILIRRLMLEAGLDLLFGDVFGDEGDEEE